MCRGSRKSRRLQPTGSSASFVRRRCDCLASSAPFTNIQTYLLTYLPETRPLMMNYHYGTRSWRHISLTGFGNKGTSCIVDFGIDLLAKLRELLTVRIDIITN